MTTPTGSSPASDGGGSAVAGLAQRGWWLEDAVVGAVLRHPGGRTLGESEHVWLAWITHNLSDVHGNADAASRTEWGQPLVLGTLTAAIVIGLASPATPEPARGHLGRMDGWSSIRLAAPVVVGDTLKAESEILAVAALADSTGGRVRRLIRGRDQRGEIVALIEEERTVPSRPASAEPSARPV